MPHYVFLACVQQCGMCFTVVIVLKGLSSYLGACLVYRRNKKQYKQHFQRGAASSELAESPLTGKAAKKTGTRVSFLYDNTIFSSR